MKFATCLLALVGGAAAASYSSSSSDGICHADCYDGECVFNVSVDLEAGQLGYFTFKECPGMVNPVIGMEVGKTYTFNQIAHKNYYHPMGFAYYADGAHDNKDELEPGISAPGSSSSCADDMTCPAPMYFIDGEYLGTYSNIPEVADVTTGESYFGLNDYEPKFFWPFGQWLEAGDFSIKLKFDDEDYGRDIFYFCHIHQFMSGRIKLLHGGEPIQGEDFPEIPYEYDRPSNYDQKCGTYGLDGFQLPNAQCPDRFVCDQPNDSNIKLYSDCNEAMNCHMFQGMTTGVNANAEVALFIHHMIPHHENAINMAKALMKLGGLQCDDFLSDTPDCLMYDILISIVNDQNAQIQQMRGILEAFKYPDTDDCKVLVDSNIGAGSNESGSSESSGSGYEEAHETGKKYL